MSWEKVRLADCCQIKPPKSEAKKKLKDEDLVSFVPMNNLGIDTPKLILEEDKSLSKVSGSYTYFADNDVLLAKITPCFENGKLGIAKGLTNGIGFGSSEFIVFRTSDRLLPEYLYYYLLRPSFRDAGQSVMTGAVGHKRVPRGFIEDTEIPLPSITEQKRIVTILDRAFADIDKARALTEQNLKNARELFESYLQQVFSRCGEGWVDTTLGQATGGVFTGPFGSLLHKSDYIENGIPLVNPAHITPTGIEADYRKTISEETADKLSSYVMRAGDIVIGRRGEMGRCALINDDEDGFICGTGSFFMKSSDHVVGSYLVRYLRSEFCRIRLEQIAGGAVMPNLSNSDLSNFSLSLPPVRQQKEISKLVDEISLQLESVVEIYGKKIVDLDELKKSVLQKAFSGELTKDSEEVAA